MLDLVVPFYNPKPGWEVKFVNKFQQLINEQFDGDNTYIHVIVVNDGSDSPFTEKEIQYLQQHIPHVHAIGYSENQGKGFALRTGVAEAKTGFCIYSDNDFPFGLKVIREMYDALQTGADIVTGCRTRGNYFRHLPLKRKIASRSVSFINKYILRLPIADTQAGIKAFNTKGRGVFLRTTINRFLFDMEFILLAGRTPRMRIIELHVNVVPGIKMSNFPHKIMQQEFRNLMSLFLNNNNAK